MSEPRPAHKRILLKLSGEALMGDDAFGINRATIVRMVEEVAEVVNMGVEVAIVIGKDGRNIPASRADEYIFGYMVMRGASSLSLSFFTELPAPAGESGGGMANATVLELL